jgi:hypothetical protein
MADYTSGSGSSVSGVSYSDPLGAASLERYVYGVLARLEEEENNLTKISDRTDRITISANLSTNRTYATGTAIVLIRQPLKSLAQTEILAD